MTTFLTSFLLAMIEKIPLRPKQKKWLVILFLILAPVLTFNYFQPEKIFSERTDDYFMNRYFANKTKTGYTEEISPVYLTLEEEYLRLPLWTEERPRTLPEAKMEIENGEITYSKETPTRFSAQVRVPEATKLIFNNYYYPGWEAYLDGQLKEIEIKKPYGNISLQVPEGEHQVLFEFRETPLRIMANLVSFFSIMIALGLFVGDKKWLKIF
jgi:uncharacterized membrane protein YfhO